MSTLLQNIVKPPSKLGEGGLQIEHIRYLTLKPFNRYIYALISKN